MATVVNNSDAQAVESISLGKTKHEAVLNLVDAIMIEEKPFYTEEFLKKYNNKALEQQEERFKNTFKQYDNLVDHKNKIIDKMVNELTEHKRKDIANEELDERRMEEVNDLYGFVCDVAALKKIPEGAYITKDEAEALNAAITQAKALYRKYD
jgi:hypothetical protein